MKGVILADGSAECDRVPELVHFRDEGCQFNPSCYRDALIRRLYADGEPARAIAARFGISDRQVSRVVRAGRVAA